LQGTITGVGAKLELDQDFNVVLDETNNSQDDIDLNKMNASVVVVPTRSIEYVVIDFIVTRSGVTFQ
jgi:phage tail sheath protein FI